MVNENKDLAHLFKWFIANKLTLNINKIIATFSNLKNKEYSNKHLLIENRQRCSIKKIQFTKCHKILIYDKLSWNQHNFKVMASRNIQAI